MNHRIHPNSLKNLKLPKDYSFTSKPSYKNKMSRIMKNLPRNVNSLNAITNTKFKKGSIPWSKGKKIGKLSIKIRKKISLSKKGNIPWNKGKSMSVNQREKLKLAWQNPQTRNKHLVSIAKAKFPFKNTKPERMMQIALTLNGIKFETHKPIIGQPDIFIEPNICIFVDGDFFHANPEKYNAEKILKRGKKASEIWARDSYVNHKLNEEGYNVIRIWESEILKDVSKPAKNILELINQLRGQTIT